jgi:hypothetical protein
VPHGIQSSALTETVDICIQTPMKRLEEMHPLAEALDKRTLSQMSRRIQTNFPRRHGACSMHTSSQSPDSKSLGPRAATLLRHQREQRRRNREHAYDQDLHPARRSCSTARHDNQALDKAPYPERCWLVCCIPISSSTNIAQVLVAQSARIHGYA